MLSIAKSIIASPRRRGLIVFVTKSLDNIEAEARVGDRSQ